MSARGVSFDRQHAVIEPAHAGTGAGKAATFVVATAIGCIASSSPRLTAVVVGRGRDFRCTYDGCQ